MKIGELKTHTIYYEDGVYKFLNKETTLIDFETTNPIESMEKMLKLSDEYFTPHIYKDLIFANSTYRSCKQIKHTKTRILYIYTLSTFKIYFITNNDYYVIAAFQMRDDAEFFMKG